MVVLALDKASAIESFVVKIAPTGFTDDSVTWSRQEAVPERGKFRAEKPGCRVRFLFGYFLFRASKEKVTRRNAETGSSQTRDT